MEQLKKYKSPEMEIILVDDSDVITASVIGGGFGGTDPFDDDETGIKFDLNI